MTNKYKVSAEVNAKVVEIATWCLANNTEFFTPFFGFSAHVFLFEFRVYPDGHKNSTTNCVTDQCYLSDTEKKSIKKLDIMFEKLLALKDFSDSKYSSENIEATRMLQAQKQLKKAEAQTAKLKAKIEAMEISHEAN